MTENYLSGKKRSLKLGVSGHSENSTSLQTVGGVGIGTTNVDKRALYVVGNTEIVGVLTATSYSGDGSGLTGVAATDHVASFDLQVAGISTFYDDVRVVRGGIDVSAGVVSATQLDIGTGGLDVDGQTDLDELIVSGVSTFSGIATFTDGNVYITDELYVGGVQVTGGGPIVGNDVLARHIKATGISTFESTLDVDGLLDGSDGAKIVGGLTADSLTISGITTGINATGVSTFVQLDVSTGGLDVDGQTNLDEVVVAGVSTFAGNIVATTATFSGDVTVQGTLTSEDKTNIDSIGLVTARTGVRVTSGGLVVTAGVSTFSSAVDLNAGIDVDGQADLDELVVAGVSTFSAKAVFNTAYPSIDADNEIQVGTAIQLGKAGVITATSYSGDGSNLTGVGTQGIDVQAQSLTVAGVSTFHSAVGINSDLTLTNTDAGSVAGPILNLYRNSASAADADYLGQIKFKGENDNDQEVNYAKITGKISDASDGSEDGILEFSFIKAGSQNINARFKSTELQLLNDTNFSVAGESTFNDNVFVGSGITMYQTSGIVSAIAFHGDGANLTNLNPAGLSTTTLSTFKDIVVSGGAKITGVTTSGSFEGDGSSLTGIGTQGPNVQAFGIDVAGISTFHDDVRILGGGLDVVGVSTFKDNLHLLDNDKLLLGGSAGTHDGLEVYHDGSHSYVNDTGTGGLRIGGSQIYLGNADHSKSGIRISPDTSTVLYYNNSEKFATTAVGATVYGNSKATTLHVAGVSTLTGNVTFAGSVNQLNVTGIISAASLDISGNVDVDGTLEADAYTVAGTALDTHIAGVTVTNSTNAAHVYVTDNESTSENNLIAFVENAQDSTGNHGLEMDGNLTYNPSSGTLSATSFSGSGANLTGIAATDHVSTFDLVVAGISTFNDDVRITGGGLNAVGVITATSFSGDGSSLTGIAATDHVSTFDLVVAGVSTFYNDVKIVGGGSTAGNQITIGATTLNDGTLTFDGTAGQLFSISNNLTDGSIFSVNDVSGMPSIDVGAAGTIQLAPYGSGELVGIGTTRPTSKLDVVGDVQVVGVVTATSFSGDGSALTNVPGATDGSFIGLNVTGITTLGDDVRITAGGLVVSAGVVTATELDISGDIDVDGTCEADAYTVAGTALDTHIAGVTVTNSTNAAHVYVTDNESTSEDNLVTFVENAQSGTGNHGLEMDGTFTYNPSSGAVTATRFNGNLVGPVSATTVTASGSVTLDSYLEVDGVIYLADSIVHKGDTNTKIRFPSADIITAETGGTERLRIDQGGNVNITGVVTASSFSGDGSALTGIAATAHVSTFDLVVAGVSTFNNDITVNEGDMTVGHADANTTFEIKGNKIYFKFTDMDQNPDYQFLVNNGGFYIQDATAVESKLGIEANSVTAYENFVVGYPEGGRIETNGQANFTGVVTAVSFASTTGTFTNLSAIGGNYTGVVTASSFSGDGSALTGIEAGGTGDFYVGFTSSVTMNAASYETTGHTFPSTASKTYTIDSIMASNVANVGVGTTVNLIASISSNSGVAAGTTEQTYFAYNIPIAAGGAIELIKEPIVANPNDIVKLWATDATYTGISSAIQVHMTYTQQDSTDFFGKYAANTSIGSTTIIGIHTAGTTKAATIQSVHITNRSDAGAFPVDIMLTNSTGVVTTYLVKNLVIPKYSSVEILERPKRMEIGSSLGVKVQQTGTIDVIVSGKTYS